jgi:phosphoribosylamine--glycine ligase/phosphoribosylaminoimidazole synthetase
VLVVGTGGREHAIAWACRRGGHDVTLAGGLPGDGEPPPDLVIPGPEAALVAGIADECARRGVPCFGPPAALARLESSKGYARELATQLGIPGPRFARFEARDHGTAARWFDELGHPVVVKLDGLAGGKGVTVPESAADTYAAIGTTTEPFVLEERMFGPECSLIAMCDGVRARAFPLAQDHKRVGEGDTGPNTGGMGAYAPAPVPYDPDELVEQFIQPVLDHYAAAGTPYVGFLYAGLMLTGDGPRLVEYNVRLGDPEAQVLLPLLDADLAALAIAATRAALDTVVFATKPGAAACAVVAAAAGYPDAPQLGAAVSLPPAADLAGALLFPAGLTGGATSGGRVLAITGLGGDLAAARDAAYRAIAQVRFEGMHYRRDIGWRSPGATLTSYAAAGVDIAEGNRAVEQMKDAVERTHGAEVVRGVGSFGGAFSAKAIAAMDDPVLVASTDGVGTKVELGAQLRRVRSLGHDIVNHCVGDVLVQSARPLFFLDYIASSRPDADLVAEMVSGMAEACAASGCTLLGGETAEMPGVYTPGSFDIAGTLVGVAERSELLPRHDIAAGDVLVGVASSGPHTNGYSLLRTVFQWIPMDVVPAGLDRPLGDALLEPHRNYLPVLEPALATGAVKALAHITGGGLPENVPRVLPTDIGAAIRLGSWPVPPLFRLVRELAPGLGDHELHRTLNMGIGMVAVCAPGDAATVQAAIGEDTWLIGELVPRTADQPRVMLIRE